MTLAERLEFAKTPMGCYCCLRFCKLAPRLAAVGTIAKFADHPEWIRRLNSINRTLNKIDKGVYHGD